MAPHLGLFQRAAAYVHRGKSASKELTTSYANAVYIPSWKKYPETSLDLAHVSHIFYAFASPMANADIKLIDDTTDREEVDGVRGCLNILVKVKESYPKLKIILSIGGGETSGPFTEIACDVDKRMLFALNAKKIVEERGLDGIDIDWERPSTLHQARQYVDLLASLREVLPSPQYMLTTALPAGAWALDCINLKAVSRHVDYINVMAYDFSGPWTRLTGHQAQLHVPIHPHGDATYISGASAVKYMIDRGVPSRQILLGIPAYGRSFLGATDAGQRNQGYGAPEKVYIYKDLPRPGTVELVDEMVGSAYCIGGDGGFVTYDNKETVRMKALFTRDKELGGLFYWEGTMDKPGNNSLIKEGHDALHGL